MLPHGNATETATAYIQRCQTAKKAIELPRLCEMTGFSHPQASRFMQANLHTSARDMRRGDRSEEQASYRRRKARRAGEEPPAVADVVPIDASEPITTAIVDRLKLMLEAIG